MKMKINIMALAFIVNIAQGQQTCRDYITNYWSESRYRVETIVEGTIVTDVKTGLIWKQCTQGLSGEGCGIGIVENMTWQEALVSVKFLNNAIGFAAIPIGECQI